MGQGDNSFGQLGIGANVATSDCFRQVEMVEKIVQISCGEHHSIFIDCKKSFI